MSYSLSELIRQTKAVADEVGQPACFYVTPTWEDAGLASLQLPEKACHMEAAIGMYHKRLDTYESQALPAGVRLTDTANADEFKLAYEAAFDGHPGWKPFMGGNLSGVSTHMLFLETTEGKLAGFAGVAWEGTRGLIFSVGVPASERGKGYGKVIVQGGLDWLARHGVQDAVVGILDTNEVSIGLHMGLGFEVFAKAEWWQLKG